MTKPAAAFVQHSLRALQKEKMLVENVRQTKTKRNIISNNHLVF
jgi:hypothetical protein